MDRLGPGGDDILRRAGLNVRQTSVPSKRPTRRLVNHGFGRGWRHVVCASGNTITHRAPIMISTAQTRAMFVAALALATFAACSGKEAREQTAAASLDTVTTSATPAVGPGVHVTRTDAASVRHAMEYELTPQNFSAFLAAADSLAALAGRDSAARTHLNADLSDAAASDADAGLRWLEADSVVNRAINSAGISVKDYFVESVAIAQAERFVGNPKAAPPTPALTKNAEFLQSRAADLERLRALREGRPVVIVKP
jgi:hypothetical protein